jgi:hypothetical protein
MGGEDMFRHLVLAALLTAVPMAGAAAQAPARKPAAAKPSGGPPVGRYVCWRLGSMGDQIADDLHILPGGGYRSLGATGKYVLGSDGRSLRFTSGPLDLRAKGQEWVGVFRPKGSPTDSGGTYQDNKIEIRRASDVAAGNARVLQACDHAG